MVSAMSKRIVMACVAATVMVAAGASAQSFTSLSDRVAALEARTQQNQSQGQQSVDMLNRIAQLESDVKAMRSLVEEMQNENEDLKQRNREKYIDLDSRLSRLEGAGASASAPVPQSTRPVTRTPTPSSSAPPAVAGTSASLAPTPSATATAGPIGEQAAYDAALASVRNDQYADSAQRFNAFVQQYPNSTLAPNAYYWMGESYYVTQNYQLALEAFNNVVTRYPNSQKMPGALLKLGYCQDGLKQHDAAEATLQDVIQRFPNTEVAEQAQSRLRAMAMDVGH